MPPRSFLRDSTQHSDGPPAPFGLRGHPHRPLTSRQQREHYTQPIGVLPALQSLLYLLVVAMFLMAFTAQPIRIPSASMEPTLLVGDFLLLDKQAVSGSVGGLLAPVSIRRGDVIVFHDPVGDPSIHLVKRIVAIPGDRLHLRNGVLYLNGVARREPYTLYKPAPADPFRDDFPSMLSRDASVDPAWWVALRSLTQDGELTVPAGDYFVLGDNRNNSEDSRYWGFVPRANIVGEPLLIYFSWIDPATGTYAKPAGRNASVSSGTGSSSFDFARWDRTFQVVH